MTLHKVGNYVIIPSAYTSCYNNIIIIHIYTALFFEIRGNIITLSAHHLSTIGNEETFLQDFLEIAMRRLPNFYQILQKYYYTYGVF